MPSDSEKTRRSFQDILHHIELAESFVAGLAYPSFAGDRKTILAVTR
jgi:uncharacterized protein with HEPN domain